MEFTTAFVAPSLTARIDGPYSRITEQKVHLRQSELDGACGQHCLFMALLALGVVTRAQLTHDELHDDGRTRFGKVWKRSAEKFLHGTVGTELGNILHPLRDSVACEILDASDVNVKDALVQSLHVGQLVIAGVTNRNLAHWVLIVGMQGSSSFDDCQYRNHRCHHDNSVFQPERFLVLDPSGNPLPYLSWNAQIEVNAMPGGYRKMNFMYDSLCMDSEECTRSIMFDELILISPR